MECDCSRTEVRRRTLSNNTEIAALQCMDCGRQKQAVKKASLDVPFDSLPVWDDVLIAEAQERERREWEDRVRSAAAAREAQSAEWWARYNAYLRSPQWRERRAAVLLRDGHLCQACLVANATQVHHLTYDHVFNEPLFDLVAICVPCHEAVTKLDREGRAG